MKYFKGDGEFFYKVEESKVTKVTNYPHCYGIEITSFEIDPDEATEITENEFLNILTLILIKIVHNGN